MKKDLTFKKLREVNTKRCEESFHPIKDWSEEAWACALAGEAGELCNFIKKRKRVYDNIRLDVASHKKAVAKLAKLHAECKKEIADVLTYLDLISVAMNISLEEAVIEKFNEVSVRVGSKRKL